MKSLPLYFSIFLALSAVAVAQSSTHDQLLLVSGRRVHVLIAGQGRPAVIFESGFTVGLNEWKSVQPNIASSVTTLSYDRAGLGKSDSGVLPRTPDQIAHDLRTMLRTAQVPPPYILVGHSAGGLYILSFARLFPNEVKGLVFLDAVFAPYLSWLKAHDSQSWNTVEKGVVGPASPGVHAQWAGLIQSMNSRLKLGHFRVPVIVVASDQPTPPFKPQSDVEEWMRVQGEFVAAMPQGRLIVTHGSHEIPEQQPQLTVRVIRQIMQDVEKEGQGP